MKKHENNMLKKEIYINLDNNTKKALKIILYDLINQYYKYIIVDDLIHQHNNNNNIKKRKLKTQYINYHKEILTILKLNLNEIFNNDIKIKADLYNCISMAQISEMGFNNYIYNVLLKILMNDKFIKDNEEYNEMFNQGNIDIYNYAYTVIIKYKEFEENLGIANINCDISVKNIEKTYNFDNYLHNNIERINDKIKLIIDLSKFMKNIYYEKSYNLEYQNNILLIIKNLKNKLIEQQYLNNYYKILKK